MALLHHEGEVGHLQDADVALDHEDGHAVGVDLGDDLEDVVHDHRRQPHRRLVDDQQPGAGHQAAADGEHLLLAAGQGPGQLRAAFAKAREVAEHLVALLGEPVVVVAL